MSRLQENTEVIQEIADMTKELMDIPTSDEYAAHKIIRETANTSILIDISKSLAIIADSLCYKTRKNFSGYNESSRKEESK